MTEKQATTETAPAPQVEEPPWDAMTADEATARLTVDAQSGLSADEVERRLAQYGPNELAKEPPPSMWVVARASSRTR